VSPYQPIASVGAFNTSNKTARSLDLSTHLTHVTLPPLFFSLFLTELQELLPSIINQLGPDNLANLKQIAEQYQGGEGAAAADDDDDDGPPSPLTF
jgi:nascent polypeptide-associated complex subunit beta